MPTKKPTVADAQLILQLGSRLVHPLPSSCDEIMKLALAMGTDENRYLGSF